MINYQVKLVNDCISQLNNGEIVFIWNDKEESIKALDNKIKEKGMQIDKVISAESTAYKRRVI